MINKNKMAQKKGYKQKHHSRHHIIPRSRGGDSGLENICIVNNREHQLYHNLFTNKRPEEIVEYLVTNFWNEDWEYVNKAIRKYDNTI